ncbi:MAG: ABC transporter ATP-binding protein [Mycobacteriales bacterium]
MAVAIRFEQVSKSFRLGGAGNVKDMVLGVAGQRRAAVTVQAVQHLHLDIAEGESVALLGHNGSGKSTTLKMLAGTVAPSTGNIFARGRVAPLLELGAGFHPDLTGRENVFLNAAILGIRRAAATRLLDDIVAFAEVEQFLDTPVKFYSSGMSVRLGFAIAVNVDPDILLVDEVLAVGDEDFQLKCSQRMSQFKEDGRTVVLVTHSLDQAKAFCERALVLDHGRLTYDGLALLADDAYHASSRVAAKENHPAR